MRRIVVVPPQRGHDVHGNGQYLAPRGRRQHRGIDYACAKGSKVLAVAGGVVSKIGFPYSWRKENRRHLRYVQVTDEHGYDARYFYVDPTVEVGDQVNQYGELGVTQGLSKIYPGITEHFHFEVMKDDQIVNPLDYLIGRFE